MDLSQFFLIVSFFLILAIIILSGGIFLFRARAKGRITRALNMSLFLITLPKKIKKETGEAPKSEKEIIAVMEQLYVSLSSVRETKDIFVYGQPHLVFEIATPQIGEEISFYLALPQRYEEVIEKQIHGFYPQASVEKVEDYNIFNPNGGSAGAFLTLNRSYILPFRTYQQLEADPLNEIVNTLTKLEEKGEGGAIQVVIRPASPALAKMALKTAKEMQQGKKFETAKLKAGQSKATETLGFVWKTLFGSIKDKEKDKTISEEKPVMTPLQEEIVKAIEGKASKVVFETNVRLLVSAQDQLRADQLLNQFEGAFVQFKSPNLNTLKCVRLKGRALKKLIYEFSFRLFNNKQKIILNTEELTSIFHFPTASLETPKVKFLRAVSATPPANIPKDGIILGRNIYRGAETIIRLKDNDRRRHLYVVGQTGTGKSVFLQNMIIQDIKNGKGVAVLDPHGDLIETILGFIPSDRAEDVVVLDPADLERPLSLNMLEYDAQHPQQKTDIVNELIGIFDKLYDLKQTGGPMFEQYTRNALLLLMDDPFAGYTLIEVPKVMADRDFRHQLLVKCKNIIVKDFWEKEAEKTGGEAALQNMVPYITSKFNVFIANDYMRPIVGQSKTSINFRQIIDEQKILLVNLSKGRLGELNSALLGLIVTGKMLITAFSRVDMPEEKRMDFYFYMDEFQSFSTPSIATILSEARKYRLCLIMAHQFIGQLTEPIRDAVFGNVGSMVSFRIGADDAEFLVKQFEPIFDQNDLINIDNFNAYIKLMISNQTSKPFNILTYPPEKGSLEISQKVKDLSRLKYGRDREEVEQEILRRWKYSVFPQDSSPPTESDVPFH